MHSWSNHDAALINGQIYRVISVSNTNVPAVQIDDRLIMAEAPDSWKHVGRFKWVWFPKAHWKFVAA